MLESMPDMNAHDSRWIVAVSGGIDSMVLLDKLARVHKQEIIVAHVDHGIRKDSADDKAFVARKASDYNCEFVATRLNLGADCSENIARQHRYAFLSKVQSEYKASAIATAHHQDDVLETIMINMIRGTGWRGLVAIRSHQHLVRPLIDLSKADIVQYAIEHQLEWRDDSTNNDPRYLRNALRQLVMPRLTTQMRQEVLAAYHAQGTISDQIDHSIATYADTIIVSSGIKRYPLIMMPDSVAYEVLSYWLKRRLTRPHVRQLLHFTKTAQVGAVLTMPDGLYIRATRETIIVFTSST